MKVKIKNKDIAKILNTEAAAWDIIRKGAIKELEENRRAIVIGNEIIKLADRMVQLETDL